jgi:hypothetical protein
LVASGVLDALGVVAPIGGAIDAVDLDGVGAFLEDDLEGDGGRAAGGAVVGDGVELDDELAVGGGAWVS